MANVTIYTDGSSLGNPGPGGYGIVLMSGPHRKELSAGYRLTTNNRMELMAVCVALEALKFAGKKNPDLWMRFLRIYRRHNVRFVWVKGHASTVENNRCDVLAVAAANGTALAEDTGYDPDNA